MERFLRNGKAGKKTYYNPDGSVQSVMEY